MFGIGMPELLVILGLALIILGPKKLPEIARGLGRAMREFKSATDEMRESLREETGELEEIKDTIVGEINRATEPEETTEQEEAVGTEEEAETPGHEAGAGRSEQESEKTDDLSDAEGGKESTEEHEKSPPG
ncbi:MAG: twin-arginine translocase TatA/TatE family subunit [Deltaproteobacteria bacterium]|nr:twin-arginine translocase TatA/TatE family subunit [Deltaproteobacteria bacterium]